MTRPNSEIFTAIELSRKGFIVYEKACGVWRVSRGCPAQWAFVDDNGKQMHAKLFDSAQPISEGLSGVEFSDFAYHIDPSGSRIYSQSYKKVGPYTEGLAWVVPFSVKNKCMYHINREGQSIYRYRFDCLGSFSEGLAVASINGTYFHIDRNGLPEYENRFKNLTGFNEGQAFALGEYWVVLIDHKGQIVKKYCRPGDPEDPFRVRML